MGSLGWPEIIAILVIVLVIFGPKRLPEIGRSLGKGIKEFKKSTSELQEHLTKEEPAAPKIETADKVAEPEKVAEPAATAEPVKASEPASTPEPQSTENKTP